MMMNTGLIEKLDSASNQYFEIGLEQFHVSRELEYIKFQAALGNLCISIELMLKCCLAKKCPRFVFSSLPLEIDLKLSYPEEFPKLNSMQLRLIDDFEFGSQSLNNCIEIFYHLFPNEKQKLKPYFNFFNEVRNSAVHSIIPNYQRIDLERIAFLSIYLSKYLTDNKVLSKFRFKTNERDEKFYSKYDENRNERVKKAIESAKLNSKKVTKESWILCDETWFLRKTSCPVCNCDAFIEGYSNIDCETTVDGGEVSLTFYAESFKCEECKLELFDTTELSLAGIKSLFKFNLLEIRLLIS